MDKIIERGTGLSEHLLNCYLKELRTTLDFKVNTCNSILSYRLDKGR